MQSFLFLSFASKLFSKSSFLAALGALFLGGGLALAAPTPTPTPAPLTFVQGTYATPQSPLTSVTLPFGAPGYFSGVRPVSWPIRVKLAKWNPFTR